MGELLVYGRGHQTEERCALRGKVTAAGDTITFEQSYASGAATDAPTVWCARLTPVSDAGAGLQMTEGIWSRDITGKFVAQKTRDLSVGEQATLRKELISKLYAQLDGGDSTT